MRVFITGGSGFVGGATITTLVGRGDTVLAMARSRHSADTVARLGATPVPCDLDQVTADHLAGCEAVVHCAAHVGAWGRYADFWRANVEGTRRMLEAAQAAGVKRFIHIGTESALFHGQDLIDADETWPLAPQSPYPYSSTKAHAEAAVRAAATTGFETLVLRPRMIWGPGDGTILPAVRKLAEAGHYAWVDGGAMRTSTTHITNLVHAIVLALEGRGRSGEAYFVLDGPPVRFRDFMSRYAGAAGIALPDKSLPGWLLRLVAAASDKLWRWFKLKGEPAVTPFAIAIMSADCILKDDKARREMGYAPVISREDGLKALEQA